MSKLLSPDQHIMRLHMQPDFPMEDLTKDNTEMLKRILVNNVGVNVYTSHLQGQQRYIHQIANRAINMLGMKTYYNPDELHAFSHGFVGFEAINDLVHPPRVYDFATANSRVAQYLVDTRDSFDIELERDVLTPAEQAAQQDDEEVDEIILINGGRGGGGEYRVTLTPAMEDALRGIPTIQVSPTIQSRADPEKIFTERHDMLPKQYPNTYDVVVYMGERRGETMAQLQMRVAGAGLARTLQTND